MQLSDLREARADAPPPRYGVDDVMTLGRRMRRRRRSAWAAGVVVAVAAAIAVPQFTGGTTRREAPPVEQIAPRLLSFDFTFTGYTAGRFRVEDPTTAGLGHMTAEITDGGSAKPGCSQMCLLTVMRPGIDVPALDGKRTESSPINGRPAYLLDLGSGGRSLVWEYADNAHARIQVPARTVITTDEMRQVATGLRPGPARPASIGFRVAYVAPDYRLTSVGVGDQRSSLGFDKAETAEARMAAPDRVAPKNLRTRHPRIEIDLLRFATSEPPTAEPECEVPKIDGPHCKMWLADGRMLDVWSGKGVPVDELRRMTLGVSVSQTTTPVSEAVPASAQLTVG